MSAFAFIFRPVWMAAINFAHLTALLLAVGGVCIASRRQRVLALVLLLAALAWAVTVAVSLRIVTLPPGQAAPGALAWAQFAGDIPIWAATVLGVVVAWRGGAVGRG